MCMSDLHIYATVNVAYKLISGRMNGIWHVQTYALGFDLFD